MAGCLCSWYWRQIFNFVTTPIQSYDTYNVPKAPNYEKLESWGSHPNKHSVQNQQKPVDVFFIHPTSLRSRSSWNDTVPSQDASIRYLWAHKNQAEVYQECCNIFSPIYRQATWSAYWAPEGTKARYLAYEDIKSAFEIYLSRFNQDRPFFIAGHSQGSEYGIRLLQDFIVNKPLKKKLIAAYLIGFPVPLEPLNRTHNDLAVCQDERDTGCLIGFGTFSEGTDPKKFIHQLSGWYYGNEFVYQPYSKYLCTNPLSWKNDQVSVPKNRHKVAKFFVDSDYQNTHLKKN